MKFRIIRVEGWQQNGKSIDGLRVSVGYLFSVVDAEQFLDGLMTVTDEDVVLAGAARDPLVVVAIADGVEVSIGDVSTEVSADELIDRISKL